MNKFLDAFDIGSKGERLVQKLFQRNGFCCEVEQDSDKRYDHDLTAKADKMRKITVEVKYDKMAQKTGNLAIEKWNTKLDKPSGLTATKADFWVQVIDDSGCPTMWLTSVKALKHFVNNNVPFKEVMLGGDSNAHLLLYRHENILEIFTRIDNLYDESRFQTIVKKGLKA